MSREEIGPARTLPPGAVVVTPAPRRPPPSPGRTPPAPDPPAPTVPRESPGSGRRRGVVLCCAVALVAGGLTGRAVAQAWDATADAGTPLGTPEVVATLTGWHPDAGAREPADRAALDLDVRVTGVGPVAVTLTGAKESFSAARIDAVRPVGRVIDPGTAVTIGLRVTVLCASPQPLQLPDLVLRHPDGRLGTAPVDGAGPALVAACQPLDPARRLLTLLGAEPDEARLRLTVHSPTGRTTEVLAVTAGGAPMSGRPLPATVDSTDRAIWLDPPATCPLAWIRTGLPRTVRLDVDAGAPATVTLDAGPALPRWLASGVCAGAGP